jgi:hypothetical protein
MLNTTLTTTLTTAINLISEHAPEALTKSQVSLLEQLAFEIECALQERHLAIEAICEKEADALVGLSDMIEAQLSHAHNWHS